MLRTIIAAASLAGCAGEQMPAQEAPIAESSSENPRTDAPKIYAACVKRQCAAVTALCDELETMHAVIAAHKKTCHRVPGICDDGMRHQQLSSSAQSCIDEAKKTPAIAGWKICITHQTECTSLAEKSCSYHTK